MPDLLLITFGSYPCISLVYSIYKYVSLIKCGYHRSLLGEKIKIEEIDKPHKIVELYHMYIDSFGNKKYTSLFDKLISEDKILYNFNNYSNNHEEFYINDVNQSNKLTEFNINTNELPSLYPIMGLITSNKKSYIITNKLIAAKTSETFGRKKMTSTLIHHNRHGLILNYVRLSRLPFSIFSSVIFFNLIN
jgi:hypothetical protein